jgi:hypothetical protein
MGPTYTIIASDGQKYGPIALEQLQAWVREGRVTAATQVWRSDTSAWVPASQYPELGLSGAPPIAAATGQMAGSNVLLERRVKISASWFFWIAGLSVVNSIISLSGGNVRFIFGLGITRLIDAFASGLASSGMAVAIGLDVVAAGIFASFGVFGGKRQTWSFAAGLVFYALDALIYVLDGSWLSVAFHAYVIYRIFTGLQACIRLNGIARSVVAPSV